MTTKNPTDEAPPTRRTRRRWLLALGVLGLLGVAVVVALRSPAVQDRLMRREIERRVALERADLYTGDTLWVLVCGSGSPIASPGRAQACVAVIAGERVLVFDIGTGAAANLTMWRIRGEHVSHVFLTHFHSDHFGDLGELNLNGWVTGRPGPLQVHGPTGVARVVNGLEEAYALDRSYRVAHHGAELLPPERGRLEARQFESGPEPTNVFTDGELEVLAFDVAHTPVSPAVGYLVRYRGRSIVISGDTARHQGLVRAAQGADLLLHEALAPHIVAATAEISDKVNQPRIAKVMRDIPDYHTSPRDAAELANQAGVKLLVLYHLAPGPPPGLGEAVFLRGVSEVRDEVVLAHDGLLLGLPVGSDAILRDRL